MSHLVVLHQTTVFIEPPCIFILLHRRKRVFNGLETQRVESVGEECHRRCATQTHPHQQNFLCGL